MSRVLLAKPGLDGHDRGIRVIAMALRDAGFEVIYIGLRSSAEQILTAAEQESVDVIGISVLSGAHLVLARALLEARSERGLDEIPIVMGGTIPGADAATLREWGVAAVFSGGSALADIVEAFEQLGRRSNWEHDG